MSHVLRRRLESPTHTRAFGGTLAQVLRPGDLLALCGALGAGKTQFVKGLAAGLGVPDDEPVVSPTFVLVREYVGRRKLYHVDAYRLSDPQELLALGLEEMLDDPAGIVALEWADRVPRALPAYRWWIELAHAGESTRELELQAPEPQRLAELVRLLDDVRDAPAGR